MKAESIRTFCNVCLLPHDEEIHQATLAVRKWHRGIVTKGFEDETDSTAIPVEEIPEPQVA